MADGWNPGDRAFPLPHILQAREVVESAAMAADVVIAVTPRRVLVADGDRTVLDIRFDQLRRIEFDIERGRDATLVIVPEHISDEPRVVSVPIPSLRETALALASIGERINATEEQTG